MYFTNNSPFKAPVKVKGTIVPSSLTDDKIDVRWYLTSGT
jgi:hypothetical protein